MSNDRIDPGSDIDQVNHAGGGYVPQQRKHVVRSSYSALQAIHDAEGRKVGYELFYRASASADSASHQTTEATLGVLDHLASPGLGRNPKHHLYFVNVTREFVIGNIRLPDPTEIAVLEIHPEIRADREVSDGIAKLRGRGYGVALDQYVPNQESGQDALLPLVSHVKLDMEGSDEQCLRRTASIVHEQSNALLVGTRIGTQEIYELARNIGCDLFQGHAVEATQKQTGRNIVGSLAKYISLLELLSHDDNQVDERGVAAAVTRDADLSLRVLRACNSASTGLTAEITSVDQAVAYLGLKRLRQTVHLAIAQGLRIRDEEQLLQLIEYATLTELVAVDFNVPPGTGFLAGLLFEVADALEMPISDLLVDLPLEPSLSENLRNRSGHVGEAVKVIDAYKRDLPIPGAIQKHRVRQLHTRAALAAAGAATVSEEGEVSAVLSLRPPRPTLAAILGPAPAPDDVAQAQQWNVWSSEHSQHQFREGSIPLTELGGILAEDEAQLQWLVEQGRLVSHDLDGSGEIRVPLWQFSSDGHIIDGVEDLISSFPGDAIALSQWVVRPCRELSRRIPLAMLMEGKVNAVVRCVQGLTTW
jgi:c-di-GMP-related signal transduction protein